jgi:pilus assembly protein CpaF
MMILMAGVELPVMAMRQQISSAVDVIIQQQRLRDGSRKITKVTEITGMEGEIISAQDVFQFVQTGVSGQGKVEGYFECTGIRPRLIESLEAAGVDLGKDFFLRRRLS